MRLLLIDDDDINNFLMSNMLEDLPFVKRYDIYNSGFEALEYLRKNIDKKDLCDFIFLDLNMPEMDGFEFLEIYKDEIAPHFPTIKIIIVTSSSLSKDRARALGYDSVCHYITKPITEQVIENLFNELGT
jgi:CheY-like chemotaxis protein